ncbi:glycerol-3-phosphate 1-O-acyltransferase PlsY [Maricaulaceae bacterium NA33B04]|nr:glycerol-3-phosphate 1-O-acyltransferase PlsY [Maricaulaceae bacterium NA33B04]
MSFDPLLLLAAAGGYLFGSVPFGLVITKLAGLGDIRDIGSGNIGATNVLRTGRKDLALATLLLDSGKAGIAAIVFTLMVSTPAGLVAAGAAFLGHCFPVWLKFNGGKGVATFLGALLAAAWPIGLMACATWLGTALLFRMSSFAALVAAALTPVWALAFGRVDVAILAVFLASLIFWRHSANIDRIFKGTEPKIGAKKA